MGNLREILKDSSIARVDFDQISNDDLIDLHKRIHKNWHKVTKKIKEEAFEVHSIVHQQILKRNLHVDCLNGPDQELLKREKTELIEENEEVEKTVRLLPVEKAKDEQVVLGVVLEPDDVDAQGDTISPQEVQNAAHQWLAKFQDRGIMHSKLANGKIEIFESYITKNDMKIGKQNVKKGTWLLMYHVTDRELWKKIKTGKLTGFSMGGFARRSPVS